MIAMTRVEARYELTAPMTDELLEAINVHFADILSSGTFTVNDAFPEEDEPDLAQYPRLSFRFNRRNLGRLRQLIDAINRGRVEVPEAANQPPAA